MRIPRILIGAAFLLLGIGEASAAVLYVDLNSTNATVPYAGWPTAATKIQDAIDAAVPGDVVIVTNGIYKNGGRSLTGYSLTNRLTVDKKITVRSVNGPLVTIVQGYQVPNSINDDGAVRCAYLSSNAVLAGFTLTNGATLHDDFESFDFHSYMGGGVCCEAGAFISNCIISGCSANDMGGGFYGDGGSDGISTNVLLTYCVITGCQAPYGGGAVGGLLNNCTISNNAAQFGGGAQSCVLNGCTISSNMVQLGGNGNGGGVDVCTLNDCLLFSNISDNAGGGASRSTLTGCTLVNNTAAINGGGADNSTLNNCIVYYNTNGDTTSSAVNYCCVGVDPGGPGNISNAPLFVDLAGGNFKLRSNSSCINSGDNAFVASTVDLTGNPRIAGLTVDMGAYEYATPSSMLSFAWAQHYGLATDGSADFADLDRTGMKNWQKSIAGLDPTNSASVLLMLPPISMGNSGGVTVSWLSVSNRNYFLQRATDLAVPSAFSTIQSDILGQADSTSYLDDTATNGNYYFYRIGVQ